MIIVQNKSSGPRVFGILATLCGLLGASVSFLLIIAFRGVILAVLIFGMVLVSWLVFYWVGVLLIQHRRKGVWVDFVSVAIGALSIALPFMISEAALVRDSGGLVQHGA